MANVALKPTPSAVIPNKLYFRIGEVSRIAGVKPHVLRYWETEFSVLDPKKSGTGHRLYRQKDVELILEIKHLLYEKRFTIEGARAVLVRGRKKALLPVQAAPKAFAAGSQADLFGPPPAAPTANIQELRRELEAILKLLR
jgi:DNA-binding transcriptional MerR regulator